MSGFSADRGLRTLLSWPLSPFFTGFAFPSHHLKSLKTHNILYNSYQNPFATMYSATRASLTSLRAVSLLSVPPVQHWEISHLCAGHPPTPWPSRLAFLPPSRTEHCTKQLQQPLKPTSVGFLFLPPFAVSNQHAFGRGLWLIKSLTQ